MTDLAIRGKQTLSENIADLAGVAAGWDAYQRSRTGKPAESQDGLTGNQLYFLAFGQRRASKEREETLRQQVLTDVHSPNRFRAFTVRNLDVWYDSFDIHPGAKMYLAPSERVRIW